MAAIKTTLARFMRGLVSDSVTAGGLLLADDVVPLPRMAGWRTRGGKKRWAALTGTPNGIATFNLPPSAGQGVLVLYFASGGTNLAYWSGVDGTFYSLPTQAVNQSGAALTFPGVANRYGLAGKQSLLFDNQLWLPGNFGSLPVRWAGQGPQTYSMELGTGTVSTTAGSTTITGSGTLWATAFVGGGSSSQVRVGEYLWINHASLLQRAYRIIAINSDTSLVVDRPLPVTVTGQSHRVSAVTWWSVKPGTFGVDGYTGGTITSGSTMQAQCAAQHAGRAFVGGPSEVTNVAAPDRLRWSATSLVGDTDALYSGTGEWGGAEYFHPNAYLDVAPGEGGAPGIPGIRALASFGGSLFIFKSSAVYILRGDVETDGRDVGAAVDAIIKDDGISQNSAPVVTPDGIMFAGARGLYLVTPQGVTNITDRAGVREAYLRMFNQGVRTLSWTGSRLIAQGGSGVDYAKALAVPNTLVWYRKENVWVTQTTITCTQVVSPSGNAGGSEVALGADPSLSGVWDGQGVSWFMDSDFSYSQAYRDEVPLMRLVSHPIPLRGRVNGRIRAVLVKMKLLDDLGTGPSLQARVLLGEQGSLDSVELPIAPSGSQLGALTSETEKWRRFAVRAGTPPVDTVRFEFMQVGGALDCRVYESGVEHVAVARLRP